MRKSTIAIIIGVIIIGIIGLIFLNSYLIIEQKSDIGHLTIKDLDILIKDAITSCEIDDRGCDTALPEWLEICKNVWTYQDVPSCNDGKIEELMGIPISKKESSLIENCDSSYPDICIPSFPPDLDCGEIPYVNFRVIAPDEHRFDVDEDGIGCES